jgi:copper chaperone CopZ
MQKIILKVKNMKCSNCAMQLEGIEDEFVGISSITASYHKQQMKVEFDEKSVSIEQIIRAAKNRGYEITILN